VEGVNSSIIYLIYCNDFCKCHNASSHNTTKNFLKRKNQQKKDRCLFEIEALMVPTADWWLPTPISCTPSDPPGLPLSSWLHHPGLVNKTVQCFPFDWHLGNHDTQVLSRQLYWTSWSFSTHHSAQYRSFHSFPNVFLFLFFNFLQVHSPISFLSVNYFIACFYKIIGPNIVNFSYTLE
jgi:hypothetical protein